VLVVLTFVQVAFAEVLPKAVALQHPNRIAVWTSAGVRLWMKLMRRPIRWFVVAADGVLRLLRLRVGSDRRVHSAEEILLLVEESGRGGVLESHVSRRIRHALQMSERPVRRVMVPRPHVLAIDLGLPAEEIVERVINSPYTRVPVYRDSIDNIVGVIHSKDVVLTFVERGRVDSIDALVRPPMFVPENVSIDRVLSNMRAGRTQQAVVLDEFGGMAGLVTLEDVLADVVGAVRRGRWREPVQAERLPDGRIRLPGLLELHLVEPWLGVRWQGSANTVSGHVVERCGYLPRQGEVVDLGGFAVEIEAVDRRVIKSVLVRPAPGEAAAREGNGHA
jgi:CBS domain containing-hemolysin-like protein